MDMLPTFPREITVRIAPAPDRRRVFIVAPTLGAVPLGFGTDLGAVYADGRLHHRRVLLDVGGLVLVPPAWVRNPASAPALAAVCAP